MKLKNIKVFALGLSICSLFSCSDYLNVSDEAAGGLSDFNDIFTNVDYTKRWYGEVFNNITNSSYMWFPSGTPSMGNPWASMGDECYNNFVNNAGFYSEWNSTNTKFSRWGTLYQSIRQANIFLENAKPIIEPGVDAIQITEDEMKWYKANIRFMRAWYYLTLLETYGPVPIIDRSLNLEDQLNMPRNSVDELVNFIDSELLEAMKDMHDVDHANQDYRAVPTKGTALAARAKLWMYAASPLFNGGYQEALELKNIDGKSLFPQKDPTKWEKAVQACKDLIDYAEAGHYELYKVIKNGKIDPDASVYEVFQVYNSEYIWASGTVSWGGMNNDLFDKEVTPRSEPSGTGQLAVYQELVDDFYMKDGLPIKQTSFLPKSPLYSEEGFDALNGVQVSKMYINREPRFYNTVTFSGKKWQISNREVQFYKGGNADNSSYYPRTGYLLYKRMNKTIYKNSPGVVSVFRPAVIYRLAEFYLLYAEALNEVDPNNSDILKYTNLVRERAGLEKLEVLNPAIKGNQDMQREAIRRESRVELCTEGQRYFDIRRWMVADRKPGEGGLNGTFTGMNLDGDKEHFNIRTRVIDRTFKRKQFLHPIPYSEIQNSHGLLIQNPGW